MTDPLISETAVPVTPDPHVRAPDIPPLAEGRWLWRRVYVFAVSTALWALLAAAVRTATPQTLPRITDGIMGLLALVLIIYLVAPTTQQLIELMANLRLRLGRRS